MRVDKKIHGQGGFSLMEVIVVIVIMGILMTISVPTFQRAIEQSKADIAMANLRSVWSAERFYWLDNRSYASELTQLSSLDLVDSALASAASPYTYSINTSPDGSTFEATATRAGGAWQGFFQVDQTGMVSGQLTSVGELPINPPAN
jgi:prepilin-type N-terminal cleavage/methylation domain-containing protein